MGTPVHRPVVCESFLCISRLNCFNHRYIASGAGATLGKFPLNLEVAEGLGLLGKTMVTIRTEQENAH